MNKKKITEALKREKKTPKLTNEENFTHVKVMSGFVRVSGLQRVLQFFY